MNPTLSKSTLKVISHWRKQRLLDIMYILYRESKINTEEFRALSDMLRSPDEENHEVAAALMKEFRKRDSEK